MPMQTRSMTKRAGEPHDLEAFNSYADDFLADFNHYNDEDQVQDTPTSPFIGDEDEDDEEDEEDTSYCPSESESDDDSSWLEEPEEDYDEMHFCPSWGKCCEENLAKSLTPPSIGEVGVLLAVQDKPEEQCVLGPRQHAGGPVSSTVAGGKIATGPPAWNGLVEMMDILPHETLPPLPKKAPAVPFSKESAAIIIGDVDALLMLKKNKATERAAFCNAAYVAETKVNASWNGRWTEQLTTWRSRFTRAQWRDYIAEVCHNLTDEDDGLSLTDPEWDDAYLHLHGKL